MTAPDPVLLDAGDVQVVGLPVETCEECGEPATHGIQIDLRAIGQTQAIGVYCSGCVGDVAERLRASLPKETP